MNLLMKKLLVVLALSLVALKHSAHAEALKQMDSPEFKTYIAEHDGLVVLLPTATWCQSCRRLEADYAKSAEDLKPEGITVIQMDYDANWKFLQNMGVDTLPRTEIYYNGVRRWEYQGGMPNERMIFEVNQAVEAIQHKTFDIARYTLLKKV
jgi:thiol-disulfide isomerase/thioredoxin